MLKDAHVVDQIGYKGRFFVYRFCGLGGDEGARQIDQPTGEASQREPQEEELATARYKPRRGGDAAFSDSSVLDEKSTPEQKQRVKTALLDYSRGNGNSIYTRTAARIVSYIDVGKYRFCSEDFTQDFGLDRKKRVMVATKLQRLGLIAPVGLDGRFYVYGFCASPGQKVDDPVLAEKAESAEPDDYEEEQELDLNGFFDKNPVWPTRNDDPAEAQNAS